MTLRRLWRKRKGQTLIYVVLLMVMLLVVAIFLFDLQYFVRLRSKTQNGVDAAVLTAANWQGKSLNMIGELNLVRATTMMLNDIPPAGTDSPSIQASDALISEMQTRICYVGPLLGYISAQQAAKNNGLRPVDDFTTSLQSHIQRNLEPDGIDPSMYEDIYASSIPYNNYNWLVPYRNMLNSLAQEEIAAKVLNTRYLAGAPVLVGDGAELVSDPGFYEAVWTRDFCWFLNRGISESDYYNFDDIELENNDVAFFPGSEFLNLYVGFQRYTIRSDADWDDLTDPMTDFVNNRGQSLLTTEGEDPERLDALSDLNWAVYDNSGFGWDDAKVASTYDFINQYLRSSVRPEYTYGGAAARMFTETRPSLLSGRNSWEHGDPESETDESLGDALTMGGSTRQSGPRLKGAERRLQTLRQKSSVRSIASAKPFGQLDGATPHSSGVVLPVFTGVRLIPTALVHENAFDRDWFFMQFLFEYFGHPNYPDVPDDVRDRFRYYIEAIERFLDHDSGFHEDWADWEDWRDEYMSGEDGASGTSDDRRDPCEPPPSSGGGDGGGNPPGGPGIIH